VPWLLLDTAACLRTPKLLLLVVVLVSEPVGPCCPSCDSVVNSWEKVTLREGVTHAAEQPALLRCCV